MQSTTFPYFHTLQTDLAKDYCVLAVQREPHKKHIFYNVYVFDRVSVPAAQRDWSHVTVLKSAGVLFVSQDQTQVA